MPRNPAVKKGHHNNRHENGLVGPGKRVSRQKSNGQINGNAKPSPSADEPLPTSSNAQYVEREPASVSTGVDLEANPDASASAEELRWRKRGSESSSDGQDQKWDNMNGSISTSSTKRPDLARTKSKSLHDVSAMQIASTILTSNPAGDTISLLIVLLALPSMVLTIVQALFASLTLMPPSGGVSPVSFLSLFDVFQGSAGSPSLGTMAVVDVICFALWVCLWNWAQNFALDLAQIQIAITLGSGNSGKSGSVNTVCFLLVLLLHSARSSGLRHLVHTKLFGPSIMSHPRVAAFARYLPNDSNFGNSPGAPSKIRSLFAVHIISQALMAFVRRRVAGTSTSTKTKRMDSEAPISTNNTLDISAQDSLFNTAASPGSDHIPPPTPTVKESKDKAQNAKKRRRQANQVRSRQPFWAALASTKVHVLREVEHNKDKASTTNSQENSGRGDSAECIWITTVEPSTIRFEAGHCGLVDSGQDAKSAGSLKPFYVRINNARWHSVDMDYVDEDVCEDDFPTKWSGSIGGLAPDCNYVCSFRRCEGDREIASIMVRTPPHVDRDQPNAAAATPARQSARPNSPTTTLKTSIQTAERTREDATNRRNKVRRNHRNALAKLDREIEALQNKLKSGSDDNKQRQKLLQAERNARQHEEAISALSAQLDQLETIPEDETVEYSRQKAAYDERNRHLTEANDSLANVKSETKNELSCIENDLTATITRKDRLGARNAKLVAEQDRLTQANIQNLSEKERKAVESAARERDQQRQTADWRRRIDGLHAQLVSARLETQGWFREIDEALLRANGPLTPEGELPGTKFSGPRSFVYGNMQPSTFVPDPNASPFQYSAKPLPDGARRPRSGTNQSAGGISNMSGDFDDADPIPPMPSNIDFESGFAVNSRKDSGSSRGQNNHSPATAGVIGSGLRSPQRGSHSPGHMYGTSSW
ncbi:hypothetical protein LTR70_007956 [Exophiala xenobiotica]|uniref:Ubiquitination network signaling protein acrB n=1 Tax=Lithohypha guttulata TaxID=1690604 RepID=A0ABR0K3B1_9EURO|nr:hypothetical protein LTR24_007802 [Lithohypha guttulata]KAK5312790.1 hypothetical protein LTR70_007956 [Exophiala xenobiotica]